MASLMKCSACGTYTMKESCSVCKSKTIPAGYKFKTYEKQPAKES